MRDHATFRISLAMVAGAVLAGCASTEPSASAPVPTAASSAPLSPAPSSSSSASSSPPAPGKSGTPLPTITKPKKPAKEPTDDLPATGWVSGMVTRGGKGPCYGLVTDEGTRYALYSTDGTELTKGDRVKAHLEPSLLRIYCGPGALMTMLEVQPIK